METAKEVAAAIRKMLKDSHFPYKVRVYKDRACWVIVKLHAFTEFRHLKELVELVEPFEKEYPQIIVTRD